MVTLIGSKKQTDMAHELIKEVIDEVCKRLQLMLPSRGGVCVLYFISVEEMFSTVLRGFWSLAFGCHLKFPITPE